MVALLTAVAVALTGQPTLTLDCGPLPAAADHAWGAAQTEPPRIWLLPTVCRSAYRRDHQGLAVLAHEILHIRPNRSEAWTRRWDDWYTENVVRWKLRRLAGG